VKAHINVPSHAQPLIRKDEPLVLFNGSAASISFSAALFRMLAIFFRFVCVRHLSASSDTTASAMIFAGDGSG
jgi:hypothetical protein